jgi:hypothetical protein
MGVKVKHRTYEIVTGVYQWLLALLGIPSGVVVLDMWTDAITPHQRDALSYMLLDVAYWGVGLSAVIVLTYSETYRYYNRR